MSSGWLSWSRYLIRMSYGNVILSSKWHTLTFSSHPNEIANFDFSQHAVALQRFRTVVTCAKFCTNQIAGNRIHHETSAVSYKSARLSISPTSAVMPRPTYNSPPEQNGRHFADDILRCIFVNGKDCILIKISLKFVPKGPIDNNHALVWIMAWRWIGDKPLSEPVLTRFTEAHICGTRGEWFNSSRPSITYMRQ